MTFDDLAATPQGHQSTGRAQSTTKAARDARPVFQSGFDCDRPCSAGRVNRPSTSVFEEAEKKVRPHSTAPILEEGRRVIGL
jgi:hypothetical protein